MSLSILVLLLGVFVAAQEQGRSVPQPVFMIRTFTPNLVGSIPRSELDSIVRDLKTHTINSDDASGCPVEKVGEYIRDAFQNDGYFKTLVSHTRCRVVARDARHVWLAVAAKIDAGAQYRLEDVTFTDSKVFSPAELRTEVPENSGDIFRVRAMRSGLVNLRKLYCRKGYINFTPVPNISIDDVHNTISVAFDLDEGDRFYFGDLVIDGEASVPGARERLLSAWKKYEGKPYDCGESLHSLLRDIHASPNVDPSRLFQLRADPQKHVMNVRITLAKPVGFRAAK